jgi:sterol 24-C-methyltransferase
LQHLLDNISLNSKADKLQCIKAYEFLQKMQLGDADKIGQTTDTEDETEAVRQYYNVLNEVLSIADIEKLYIPPLLDEYEGLYKNQLMVENFILSELELKTVRVT